MIFHHLDRTHIVMIDAVGGYAIFTAEKVGAFDIELVDVLALILNLAVFGNIDAGHSLQHIAYGAILLLGEAAYIICNRCYISGISTDLTARYRRL